MPEGPEVALMADQIQNVSGCYLYSVVVKHIYKYDEFDKLVLPQQVNMIFARGKKLVIMMSQQVLVFSPLMTGKLLWKEGKYTRAILGFYDDSTGKYTDLYLDDKRTIALINVFPVDKLSEYLYSKVGPDWLHDDITFDMFRKAVKKRKIAIGRFLIDQHTFSGIGNYLRAEILYASQINPHRISRDLTDEELDVLYRYIRIIIKEAYLHKGLTISDYLTPNSERGTYEPKCYGRTRDSNNFEVKVDKLGTQNIYWVPTIQK